MMSHGRPHVHDGHASGPERMWHRQEARADLVERFWTLLGGRPGWRVADVGAGPGYFAVRYAGLTGPTGHVHAVDVDEEALAYLRAKLDPVHHAHVTTEVLDVTRAPLPDLHFHAVICTAMLHHVDDVPAALRNLRLAKAPLLVAEFDPDGPGELGPPLEDRLGADELLAALRGAGFTPSAPTPCAHEAYAIVAR